MNDSGCNNLSNEFVFPDEATTAKLLAVNTAAKNLKRQHNTMVTITATTTSNTSAAAATTSNLSNTIKLQNNETELTEFYDFNEASTSSSAFVAAAGYSTRLFYGSPNNNTAAAAAAALPHKSVIVSTQSQLNRIVNIENSKINMENTASSSSVDVVTNGSGDVVNANNGNTNDISVVLSNANNYNNNHNTNVEDVNNLQAISSHETKKARRVQKTTRCLTNSSGKRK